MSNIFDEIENLEEILASLSEEELQEAIRQVDARLEEFEKKSAEADEEADADEDLEEDLLDNKIILNDEDGNEAEFEFLDLIEYEGEDYVVLLPCEDDDQMVVILRIEGEDDGFETYESVDDDDTLQAVFEIFKERAKDLFDFED